MAENTYTGKWQKTHTLKITDQKMHDMENGQKINILENGRKHTPGK